MCTQNAECTRFNIEYSRLCFLFSVFVSPVFCYCRPLRFVAFYGFDSYTRAISKANTKHLVCPLQFCATESMTKRVTTQSIPNTCRRLYTRCAYYARKFKRSLIYRTQKSWARTQHSTAHNNGEHYYHTRHSQNSKIKSTHSALTHHCSFMALQYIAPSNAF